MVQSFASRGISHCDRETFFFQPRDKNLATASSNSQRRFYHSSDFDSIMLIVPEKPLWGGDNKGCMYVYIIIIIMIFITICYFHKFKSSQHVN